MTQDELDEVIGITRCAQCGQRLDGEIECHVCSSYYHNPTKKHSLSKWTYLTAYFLTSPLSIYLILKTTRLSRMEKLIAASGCLLWATLFLFR